MISGHGIKRALICVTLGVKFIVTQETRVSIFNFYVPGRKKNKQGTFFPARNSVLITDFSKPDPVRKSQPVNDLMLIFPSQRNFSLSSGFSVERLRQVLLCCLFCFFFRSLFYPTEVIFSSKSRKQSLE